MNINTASPIDLMVVDLAKSQLEPQDIMSRVMDESVALSVSARPGTKGYVIPYFNIYGALTQYYRVKVLGGDPKVKYLQMKGAPNHVYFPKNWSNVWAASGKKLCILTEGEKKATLITKHGIPAVAFGGVDSWRNKIISLPSGTEQLEDKSKRGPLRVKLPDANTGLDEMEEGTLALGFQELIDEVQKHAGTFLIAYDSTSLGTTAPVQRAAAKLGFELRFKGFSIAQIRQLSLPSELADAEGKVTIEDLIVKKGTSGLIEAIEENAKLRVAFPTHPNVREHIAKQLQKPKLSRKEAMNTSLALLTELDVKGTRMYSPDDLQMYYFNGDSKHLMKVDINKQNLAGVHETEFGQLLYKKYSISTTADTRLMQWLGAQFAGEDPIEFVTPYRIIGKPKPHEDCVRLQINNGQYIKISSGKDAYQICSNGSENTLFESQNIHVEGIDADKLKEEILKRFEESKQLRTTSTAMSACWWGEVIKEVRLRYPGRQGELISLLYYISPYLLRWRGTQLPAEIIVGEAGSGKSTLCEIRLNILTGDPKLRNTPKEQKDWYASLANCGGFTVFDNMHMTDKNLRQSMSDELCRLITELDPRINMRKYFTEADERSIRINSVFGFTGIQMPFQNGDLLQRSVVLELMKQDDPNGVTFDANWKDRVISRYGGRTAWLAHHCFVLNCFFNLVKKKWDNNYQAKHRLVNLEQALILMAEVFGQDGSWIPQYLSSTTDQQITNADWTMEGLMEYANLMRTKEADQLKNWKYNPKVKAPPPLLFTSTKIADWAASHDEYEKNFTLSNPRALGRYMQANKYNIAHICGIVEEGKKENRMQYRISTTKK